MNVTEDEMQIILSRRHILRVERLREKHDAIDRIASMSEAAQNSGVRVGPKSVEYNFESKRMIEAADCALSLFHAIDEAGGSVSSNWLDMTLREFIAASAAQNHIRFVFEKPKEAQG